MRSPGPKTSGLTCSRGLPERPGGLCINALESLRQHTRVVADTGDFLGIEAYRPEDATTNPSLILRAVQQQAYRAILREASAAAEAPTGVSTTPPGAGVAMAGRVDRLLVRFGMEILRLIPGRVSTEVDARLSFDANATFGRAMGLAEHYARMGVAAHRVLIKIAATWEGIEAAQRLEQRGVQCNLTLVFSLTQARACADAGVQLISPFVGRITDWFRQREQREYAPHEDPGVESVRRIHRHFKQHGYRTEIMGASFRSPGQVLALAGCDLLTISPGLLGLLKTMEGPVERQLFSDGTTGHPVAARLPADPLGDGAANQPAAAPADEPVEAPADEPVDARFAAGARAQPRRASAALSQAQFRWELNEDAMATEKLAEGIRIFAADGLRLEQLLAG